MKCTDVPMFRTVSSSMNCSRVIRSAAGRSDESVRTVEDSFVELWQELPAEQRDRLTDVLVAYVKSPLFIRRRAE